MRPSETNLFGEPARLPENSQLWTPLWIARRMAAWIARGSRILEPSCGDGNLIQGALDVGHRTTALLGVERDVRMADAARMRFADRIPIIARDFFDLDFPLDRFDASLANFKFEDNWHLKFTLRALQLAPVLVGIFPVTFEYTQERDRELWANVAKVTRRAKLPERVEYEGAGGSFESVVLRMVRRTEPRRPYEELPIVEETWRKDDEAQAAVHLLEVP